MAVGVMASFGVTRVQAVPRPTLGIIGTGNEFTPPGEEPKPGQIRNSNSPMLLAMAREHGIEIPRQLHATDCLDEIVPALERMSGLDIVLLTGGVSAGAYDLVPKALARYGAKEVFHGVNQKPGKPLLLARKDRQMIFGLPGNPMACHFGFHRYVFAAIQKMSGGLRAAAVFQGELTQPIQPRGGRPHFIPGCAQYAVDKPGTWQIEPLPGVSAADIFLGSEANCYVEVEPGDRTLEAGNLCSFTWLGRTPWDT